MKTKLISTTVLYFSIMAICFGQTIISERIMEQQSNFTNDKVDEPFQVLLDRSSNDVIDEAILKEKIILQLDSKFNGQVLNKKPEFLNINIPLESNKKVHLQLNKIDIRTQQFQTFKSSDKSQPFNLSLGEYYWGIVEGDEKSLAAINIYKNEISGMISVNGKTYSIGKLLDKNLHVVYQESNLSEQPVLECFTGDLKETIEDEVTNRSMENPDACIKMYIEVDNDLYNVFGSVTETTNYVLGAFSQVAILYANEEINFTVNEVLVWDTEDPYTGPSSSNYLTQFRNALNGNYNGDLAHLVGTAGGGGIAYVNVICSATNGVAYSGVNTTYQNVPTYSWTVNVLTHEIGHNLGSPHTHACAWNGDNTQIDDCGNMAISNPGSCYDENNPILPEAGTIMSYCHLSSGIGIDPSLGFGQQPGDLIRDNVYNASCLGPCEECPDTGIACDDGLACTVNDTIDVFCNCIGDFLPDLDNDGYCGADDPDDTNPCIPDDCGDCTLTTISITVDNYATETSWDITDDTGAEVSSGGPLSGASGTTINAYVCLEDGCYDFTIYDSYGDGICCGYGNGSYTVTDDVGNVLASGGEFTTSETTNFCYDNFGTCTEGASCDDGDACTIGDAYDANCDCAGTFQDSDGDGVCDADDLCPGDEPGTSCDDGDVNTINDVIDANCNCIGTADPNYCPALDLNIGDACDDGDACTTNDTVDANCDCAGTFQDSDGDGVCDAEDQCPGEDDTIDVDGNGIPDACETECVDVTDSFDTNPLTHTGAGSSSTTLDFGQESSDVSFTISEIGQKTNGKTSNRYIEIVTVSYVDGAGNTVVLGPYSGADQSSVNIVISGSVQSVTVTLEDGYDGSTNSQMSISFSTVTVCQEPCADSDGDGVCDTEDQCPGFDDNQDADGDGIPDGCDNCSSTSDTFDPSNLTHSGSGSSSSSVLLVGVEDPSFTISNLGSKVNGNPNSRYIDQVTISYIDASGNTIVLGPYSGADQNSVDVSLDGAVSEITVSLTDAYDGNSPNISVSLSTVVGCNNGENNFANTKEKTLEEDFQMIVYPNPFSNNIQVSLRAEDSEGTLELYDNSGRLLHKQNTVVLNSTQITLDAAHLTEGVYILRYKDEHTTESRMIIKTR